ncbi:MAG: exonuclease SbcCD subunit D C-terminal domain-containing protein, partial [Cyanobium sp.]
FSEQHHTKSVRLVELDGGGRATVEVVPLGVGRPLGTLEGSLETLLHDPRHDSVRGAWLRVVLTDEQLPLQAMARLRQRFPHVAELRHRPPERQRATVSQRHQQVRESVSPLELSLAFFADQQGRPASAPEVDLLRRALEAALRGGEG